jgi:hypothetical protein
MKTNKYYTEAENETFLYRAIDEGILIHKASGKAIYQMHWLDDNGYGSEPVVGEARDQAIAFWQEYFAIQEAGNASRSAASIASTPSAEDIAHEKFVAAMEDEYSDL